MDDPLPPSIFSILIHDSLDAVLIIDREGIIRYANPAFESLCGYSANEVTRQSLNGLLPEAVAACHDAYLKHYLDRGGASTVLGGVREMQVRHRTGEVIPVEMKAVEIGVVEHCHYFAAFMVDLRPRKQLEAQNEALLVEFQKLALTDALTELPNRRAFDMEARRMLAATKREMRRFCVGIADLDRFKCINDAYGHHAGDIVLKAVAQTMKEGLRAGDFIGRTGGEEFGIVFSGVDHGEATAVADRIRRQVESRHISVEGGHIKVTISIGVACVDPAGSLEEATSQADRALYRAKNNGRNRVEVENS